MAVKACACVTRMLMNSPGTGMNIYVEISCPDVNGSPQFATDTLTDVPFSSSEHQVNTAIVAFVKTYATANFGASFQQHDTVRLMHYNMMET